MNKLGFGIIGLAVSTLVISISALIFSYQLSSLKLLNLKATVNLDSTCRQEGNFSICEAIVNNTKFANLDYNFLFKEPINCGFTCFEKNINLNKQQTYSGNLYSEELINSNENLLAVSGHIKINSLKTTANLTIVAFKKIEIRDITCSGNSIFLYSILSDVKIQSSSNCIIHTILDSTNLKLLEKVILKATY